MSEGMQALVGVVGLMAIFVAWELLLPFIGWAVLIGAIVFVCIN